MRMSFNLRRHVFPEFQNLSFLKRPSRAFSTLLMTHMNALSSSKGPRVPNKVPQSIIMCHTLTTIHGSKRSSGKEEKNQEKKLKKSFFSVTKKKEKCLLQSEEKQEHKHNAHEPHNTHHTE